MGVTVSAVSAYESDSRYPSYDVLIHFARIFHVSTDYLLGLEKGRSIDISGLNEDEISIVAQLIDLLKKKQVNSDKENRTLGRIHGQKD